MDMRETFMQITKGWASNGTTADLSNTIKEAEAWLDENAPALDGEDKTLRLMRQAQQARGGLSEGGGDGARPEPDDFKPDSKEPVECGLRANGRCSKDGSEDCKRCPARQGEFFVGSKAWKKKHGK